MPGRFASLPSKASIEFLQRPRVQALWEDVNRVAHEELLAVLNDETRGNITTGSGTVTLNLRTLVVNIGTELGFGEELDARLPPDAGQIVILQSDQLEAAQTGVKAIKWMSALVIVIALACYAGAIWLARGRRSMLRNVGVALLVVGILLLVIRRAVGNYITDALASGESVRGAVDSSWLIGTSLLSEVAWALIVYGVVILLGTLLAGPWRYAVRMRQAIGPTLRDRPGLAWGALAAIYLLLVLWAPVPALRNWPGILLLGALVALGFEAFRRVVAHEVGPGGSAPPPSAPRGPGRLTAAAADPLAQVAALELHPAGAAGWRQHSCVDEHGARNDPQARKQRSAKDSGTSQGMKSPIGREPSAP